MGINHKIRNIVFLIPFFTSLSIHICTGQEFEWIKEYTDYASVIENVQKDKNGNLFIYGRFTNTCHWDNEHFSTSSGVYDIFILKYNTDHQLEYSTKIGSPEYDSPVDFKLNMDDELIFCGKIGDNAIFYDTILTNQIPDHHSNVFLAKYSNDYQRIWIEKINEGTPFAIDTDNDGNIYVLGAKHDPADSLYYRPNFHTLKKYDASCKLIWQKDFPDSYASEHSALKISNGGILIAFREIRFNNYQYFFENTIILKADSSGNEIWKKEYPSCFVPHRKCLTVDNNGIYLITKNYLGPFTMDISDNSSFNINKMDEFGNPISEFKIKADYGYENWDGVFPALITSCDNNLYVCSTYGCKHVIINNIIYGNSKGSFIAKLTSDGDLVWFQDISLSVNSFILNPDESIYVSGGNFIGLLPSYTELTIEETGPFIYPNPGDRYFNITNRDYETETWILEIFNTNGQLKNSLNFDEESIQIDLSTYGSGIYFFKFQNNLETIVKKVIVN